MKTFQNTQNKAYAFAALLLIIAYGYCYFSFMWNQPVLFLISISICLTAIWLMIKYSTIEFYEDKEERIFMRKRFMEGILKKTDYKSKMFIGEDGGIYRTENDKITKIL